MADFNPEENVGTIPVQEKHQFDVGSLTSFMQDEVEGFSGPLTVEEFAGGQSNPTYLLSAGEAQYVMRRKPPGVLLKSAHAVDREYRVLKALQDVDVPVPRVYALCTDDEVIGTWFYIMEYQQGRVIWDVNSGPYSPEERAEIWDAACVAQAKLHSVDFEAVGLGDYGRHGNYVARQMKRWSEQYEYTKTVDNPYMDNLIEYLSNNIPAEDETACAIVHGDFKFDNLMMHPDRYEVTGILDWELSTLGNPLSDFAYLCRPYRETLAEEDLKALGIPSEEEYIARYCELTGRSGIEHWDYYLAFNMFRLAAILQGIARRFFDGTASSKQAESAGAGAMELSKKAWEQIERA